jgi:D-3-phosphoglycerate dehydrogenase
VARNVLGTARPVRRIECSLYGGLDQYAKWLWPCVAAGIGGDFEEFRLQDLPDTEEYLAKMGISSELRPVDDAKGYGKSVTIDLFEGTDSLSHVSVRGTLTEGHPVISRINDFERLYFLPEGHSLVVCYTDRPGVLARITGACADEGINIDDIHAPRDRSATRALAVLKTNRAVPAEAVERIRRDVGADVAFAMSIPPLTGGRD